MKAIAYIFVLSLLILGAYPMITHLQNPVEQSAACCDACCCDASGNGCSEEGQEEEGNHSCDAACDCGCQFHLNAIHFQFNNLQVAEEQEYFFGEYHNEYSFEYFSPLIHPPRFV